MTKIVSTKYTDNMQQSTQQTFYSLFYLLNVQNGGNMMNSGQRDSNDFVETLYRRKHWHFFYSFSTLAYLCTVSNQVINLHCKYEVLASLVQTTGRCGWQWRTTKKTEKLQFHICSVFVSLCWNGNICGTIFNSYYIILLSNYYF